MLAALPGGRHTSARAGQGSGLRHDDVTATLQVVVCNPKANMISLSKCNIKDKFFRYTGNDVIGLFNPGPSSTHR